MKHGRFKRLTPQQVRAYATLRILGMMVVAPDDARPLRALQRRGLVRYRRIEGVRYASPALAVCEHGTSGALRRRMARQPVACSASHDTRRR